MLLLEVEKNEAFYLYVTAVIKSRETYRQSLIVLYFPFTRVSNGALDIATTESLALNSGGKGINAQRAFILLMNYMSGCALLKIRTVIKNQG